MPHTFYNEKKMSQNKFCIVSSVQLIYSMLSAFYNFAQTNVFAYNIIAVIFRLFCNHQKLVLIEKSVNDQKVSIYIFKYYKKYSITEE